MNIPGEYAMFSQNNLTCYWGNREELSEKQRKIIKDMGYRFRGKNQWLYFMSFQKGYFPYNMDKDEVRRMTEYLELLADAAAYYRENGLKTDFEHGKMFYYSKEDGKVLAEERELPFTGYHFPTLTLTDDELIQELRDSQKVDTVLEADLVYSGAAVADEEYDRPANPCLCLLAEAKTGMMLKADHDRTGGRTRGGAGRGSRGIYSYIRRAERDPCQKCGDRGSPGSPLQGGRDPAAQSKTPAGSG